MRHVTRVRGVDSCGPEAQIVIKVVEFEERADRSFICVFPNDVVVAGFAKMPQVLDLLMKGLGFEVLSETDSVFAKQGPYALSAEEMEEVAEEVLAEVCGVLGTVLAGSAVKEEGGKLKKVE